MTVLALFVAVSAEPYAYGYGTLPYTPRAAYTAAEPYNPTAVAPLPTAYYPTYPAGYPTAYSAAYSEYPRSYAALLSGAYSAPLPYNGEVLAALYNPLSSFTPAGVFPVAPLTYASPQSYVYKR